MDVYGPTSAAIWKRDVLAVVIASVVWTVDCGFLIYGKHIFGQSESHFRCGLCIRRLAGE